ncbi:MAG: J domain-containing protein [Cyanobium sp.]
MSTPSPSSHYELLELSPAATPAELRQAFRRLSKRYHPDTTSLPPPQAEEAFRRLQLAYGVLSDPLQRNRYDTLLQGAGASPGSSSAAAAAPARGPVMAEAPRAVGVRRALSGGEWFALLLLGLALVLSLVLAIGVAWARGTALVRSPSWWTDAAAGPAIAGPARAADPPAAAALPMR